MNNVQLFFFQSKCQKNNNFFFYEIQDSLDSSDDEKIENFIRQEKAKLEKFDFQNEKSKDIKFNNQKLINSKVINNSVRNFGSKIPRT